MQTLMTVSYTHLDVYKRQGKRGLKIGKISSSHKGICVHTPNGKKIFIDENGKTKVIWDN